MTEESTQSTQSSQGVFVGLEKFFTAPGRFLSALFGAALLVSVFIPWFEIRSDFGSLQVSGLSLHDGFIFFGIIGGVGAIIISFITSPGVKGGLHLLIGVASLIFMVSIFFSLPDIQIAGTRGGFRADAFFEFLKRFSEPGIYIYTASSFLLAFSGLDQLSKRNK